MPNMLNLRPADGLIIRDPDTMAPLPTDRDSVVPDTVYWRRRMRDGDVTETKPGKAAPEKQTKD